MSEHVTDILVVYTNGVPKWYYEVRCSLCGSLGTYMERTKAENRKSTHDRVQDAGAD